MEKVKRNYKKFFLCGFLIGTLGTLTCLTFLFSYRFENNYNKIRRLELKLEESEKNLEKLKSSIKVDKMTVKEVDVKLQFKEEVNEVTKYILENNIKEKYSNLIGREINSIDIEMLDKVIDNRIMYRDKERYVLKVNKIMISHKIILYIECSKIDI